METPAALERETNDEDARRGVPARFETFFESEHVRLFRALYLVTGSTEEAEELMQEAFLKTWERWGRVSAMENPTGYLYRIGMNAFRSRYRVAVRAGRRVVHPGRPRDLYEEADDRDAVARAMRTLAPRQRAALVLVEVMGFSSEEAGGLLGVKAASVRALAHQGRVALRKAMEGNDG